jgi:hypothetical protein
MLLMHDLEKIAELLKRRKQFDLEISRIIGRPSLASHIGEYIASKIFKIKLADSATTKGIDGAFFEGRLKGKTVNIKLYGKQEGILDISLGNLADYYLVFTGPTTPPVTSRGKSRPIVISHIYLFEMPVLVNKLRNHGVKIGISTSVAKQYWTEAEIYPQEMNNRLGLTEEQKRLIKLFH